MYSFKAAGRPVHRIDPFPSDVNARPGKNAILDDGKLAPAHLRTLAAGPGKMREMAWMGEGNA
jgi:hypothetical protein